MKNADNDSDTNNATGSRIGLLISVLFGVGLGYWAYVLDPSGRGASILILPVIAVALVLIVVFFVTGLVCYIAGNGRSLMLGSVITPAMFLVSTNVFRSLFFWW